MIAIKTPFGITERVKVKKFVSQGEVNSNLKCTVTVDSISQNHAINLKEHLYEYRNLVAIPPLGMVDDQVAVAKCGLDSVLASSHLNAMTNVKKLQFGANKCHKMHIGKSDILCSNNTVDTWSMESEKETPTSIFDFVDVEGESHIIEKVKSDVYLGDVLQNDG